MSHLPLDNSANICAVLERIAISALGKTANSFLRSSPISASYIAQLFVLQEPSKMFNSSYEEMTEFASSVLQFSKVSRQALAARITSFLVSFMMAVLARAITSVMPSAEGETLPKSLKIKGIKRILIADSTIIQLPDCMKKDFPGTGGSGKASKASLKIFHEFDLLGKFAQFQMAPGKTADATFNDIESIKARDLVIRDLGFKNLVFLALIKGKGAFFIQRLYCNTLIYLVNGEGEASETPLDLESFARKHLNTKAAKNKTHLPFDVQLGLNKETREALGTVRLVALRISDKKAAQKVENARKEAKRNGTKLSKAKEILCHWHICFTNLSEEQASIEDVIELYRLRWQIELRFKSWKSTLRIDTVTVQSGDRLKCSILGFFTQRTLLGDIFTEAKLKAEEEEIALFNAQQASEEAQSTRRKSPKTAPDTISDAKLYKIMANCHHKIVQAFVESREKLKEYLDEILSNLMEKARKEIKKIKPEVEIKEAKH